MLFRLIHFLIIFAFKNVKGLIERLRWKQGQTSSEKFTRFDDVGLHIAEFLEKNSANFVSNM